ncbi:class F sortase [Streptomyces marincola]|uniref:class F sortase n=1 Tax=Streptomyces marincola TaxID=2878388 RepID=UPI001CF23FDF|nr:class F sortase [Streptomyces marincola]UCM88304.1 class F sortase [Streptomyces marincola]
MARGEPRSSPAGRLAAAATWAVLLLALSLWGRELTGGAPAGPLPAGGQAQGARLPPPAAPLPGDAEPRAVEFEAVGVRADVVPRGLDDGGGVAPPPFGQPDLVGWYADGPTPGAEGAAVLVGHLDTEREPAVFHGLSEAEPGDAVRVTRADGSVAEFAVRGVEVVERGAFDAARVYGPRSGGAELRLITCGGDFDPATRAYSANVVVSAYLTGRR